MPHAVHHLFRRTLPATVALLAACGGTPGGTPSPSSPAPEPVERQVAAPLDSAEQARATLVRSLEAMGGREAAMRLRGFEIALSARPTRGNWQQARDWTDSTPNPIPAELRYLVDLEKRRVSYELNSVSPGAIRFNYLTYYDTAGAWQIDLMRWRLGTDIVRAPAAGGRAPLSAAERLLPHALARQALLGDSLRPVTVSGRDGRALLGIRYVDATTRQPVTIEFDSTTALPTRVVTGANAVDFDDWREHDGLRIPFKRLQLVNGQVTGEQTVVRLDLAPSLADDRFVVPSGYSEQPPRGTPVATKLAEGVYRLDEMPGGYHAAFVVWDSEVIVLEAPVSAAFTEAALRVIGETAPGKPVTHVFATHHHSDHVGGMGPYVSQGATIVVGAGLEEAVRRQLPDSLRARAKFIPVDARRTFGRGARRIDAHPVPNTHANGNVAYFLPAPRILFQGDLVYLPERGDVPPAFETGDALAQVVRANRLRIDRVVGVHGRTGTWAEIERSLKLRAER